MKYKLTIEIEGNSTESMLVAVNEVTRVIEQGYIKGSNGNEESNYRYDIETLPIADKQI